jgi:hypothetical protein
MLSVLDQYFAVQNAYALAASPSTHPSQRKKPDTKRRWLLHVWTLSGPPATWDDQLREHLAREPVFAAISGLGGKEWGPVHRFCEQAALPCIFPNVDLPVVAEQDFYSLYFSKGVLLEAELLAQRLMSGNRTAPARRIVQIFRADDVGEPAAAALSAILAGMGIHTIERPLSKPANSRQSVTGKQLAAEMLNARQGDALVLWLRPSEIAILGEVAVSASEVFISGLMGGLDAAPLPAAWRSVTRMAYPLDLPEKRNIRVDYALGWFALHRIPIVAEQVQVDTYVACTLVLETLAHMPGSFVPDYLVERMEGMLEHQLVSGYYPRLALAPNERFASKGGYIVHFANPTGRRVLPDADWRVP